MDLLWIPKRKLLWRHEMFRPVRLKSGCLVESQGKFRLVEPFSRTIVKDYAS